MDVEAGSRKFCSCCLPCLLSGAPKRSIRKLSFGVTVATLFSGLISFHWYTRRSTEGVSCSSDDCSACCSPCADLKTEDTMLPSGPCLIEKVSVAIRCPVEKTPNEPESTMSAGETFALSLANAEMEIRPAHSATVAFIALTRALFNRTLLKPEPGSALR